MWNYLHTKSRKETSNHTSVVINETTGNAVAHRIDDYETVASGAGLLGSSVRGRYKQDRDGAFTSNV